MAETYGVFDYRALPLPLVATLAAGLREDSRVRMKHSNAIVSPDSMLLIGIIDRLNWLMWSKTTDAEKGRNRPKPILDGLFLGARKNGPETFKTGADFEKARNELLQRVLREE